MNSKANRSSRATSGIQINAKDIVLKPFTFAFEEDTNGYISSVSKITDQLRKTKLQGFLSTPCFI